MKLVIDIPDECYEELTMASFPIQDAYRLVAWIKDGTLLPKGHGRLIDAEEAKEAMMYEMCGTGYQGRAMRVLDSDLYVSTIIEAE